MGRRVILTIIVASLALMLALAGGPAALAATKRLPVKAGRTARPARPGGLTLRLAVPSPPAGWAPAPPRW